MTVGGSAPGMVEVLRGGRCESVHEIDLAVVDATGETVARAGRPEAAVFVRSAIKPFQALPLVIDDVADRYDLTAEELALCCASHSGEDVHVMGVRSILSKIGLTEDDLACGPHPPFSSEAAAALRAGGEEPGRIHNNCSGKHAGMLALAVGHGWPTAGYEDVQHEVQRRVLKEVERWSGVDRARINTAVDGCGVVTFALPPMALAAAFARLVAAADDPHSSAGRIVGAVRDHPHLVAGSNRLCTELMRETGGRIVAKVGAEGVYAAAVTDREWGIALKARDGARRAAETALMGVLHAHGLLTTEEESALERWLRPVLTNTRGEVVGEIRAQIEVSE